MLALVLLVSSLSRAAAGEATANDMARLLAGLPPAADSPLASLAEHRSWKAHARRFDAAWSDLERRQLTKIRAWTAAAITQRRPVVFYMFSGPDFLYADALLPGAKSYVLSGLEPTAEGLRQVSLSGELAQLQASLNSVFSFSFFRTKEMKVRLRSRYLDGTMPILLVFLARADKTVHQIEPIGLDKEGEVHAAGEPKLSKSALGVRITFSDKGSDERKTLYYFSTNVDNDGVRNSGFLPFCAKLGTGDSLVKSASYLMHQSNFSQVRDFLLANSAVLIEDDSGIPVRYFDQSGWKLEPYGAYLGPIDLFPSRYQRDLQKLYRQSHRALTFGIGYRYRPRESNLLVATRTQP